MNSKQLANAGLALGLSLTGYTASAQESLQTGDPNWMAPAEGQRLPITFSAGVSYQASSDIDNAGELEITRFKSRVAVPVVLTEEFTLNTMVSYELADYDFDKMKSPWSTVHTATIAPMLNYKADEKWTVFGAPILRIAAENGADVGDSINGGGLIGANYMVSDTLTVGAGLGVISQIEDDAALVPILTGAWQFADAWKLQAGFFDVATRGVGAQLVWDINLDLEASFGATMHKSRFRLDDSPRNKDGVGQESATTLFAKLAWRATEDFSIEGFGGVVVGGEILIEDDSGDRPGGTPTGKEDYDPAGLFGLTAIFKF